MQVLTIGTDEGGRSAPLEREDLTEDELSKEHEPCADCILVEEKSPLLRDLMVLHVLSVACTFDEDDDVDNRDPLERADLSAACRLGKEESPLLREIV